MDKVYAPQDIERRIYERWESRGWFAPRGHGAPYCIMIPPPNVTGTLHMGHAFQHTLMDTLTRYHRMRGEDALWQPGTDHAGIATQMVVERQRELLSQMPPALDPAGVLRMQQQVRAVHVADALLDYSQSLIARARERSDLKLGLSPRAGQGLLRAARSWAYLDGRAAALPEDIQAVLPAVVAHRLQRREPGDSRDGEMIAAEIVRSGPVPV
jgi:hypothetical protein